MMICEKFDVSKVGIILGAGWVLNRFTFFGVVRKN